MDKGKQDPPVDGNSDCPGSLRRVRQRDVRFETERGRKLVMSWFSTIGVS